MSKRFGGTFSPDRPSAGGTTRADLPPTPRHPHEGRPKWITLAATPFLLGAFFQGAGGMVTDLAAFGLVASGMWMTREGLVAQATYDARRVAKRPAIPRKLFGGVLAGLGLGLGAAEPGVWADAGLIGAAGLALHQIAFGLDPWRDKAREGVDDFQQGRAQRMIDEAEGYLTQMHQAIDRLAERRLSARIDRFDATVRQLFDRVRENPAGLASARRYLGVYLMGARDATIRFADLYAISGDAGARRAYEGFLDDLERDFNARADRLLDGDRDALEIEMAVLRDRLAREGLTARTPSDTPPALRSQEAQTLDELLSMPLPDQKTPRD